MCECIRACQHVCTDSHSKSRARFRMSGIQCVGGGGQPGAFEVGWWAQDLDGAQEALQLLRVPHWCSICSHHPGLCSSRPLLALHSSCLIFRYTSFDTHLYSTLPPVVYGLYSFFHFTNNCKLEWPYHFIWSLQLRFLLLPAVQSLSCVWLFETPRTAGRQAALSFRCPGVCSDSCPLRWWCHSTIPSSVALARS